ncbi:MAG: alpha-glucan family phosphorylase [bacterium]
MLNRPPEHLPHRLRRLWDLAHNLWWTWHPGARSLFRELDHALWRSVRFNPVALLRRTDPVRLEEAASREAYLDRYMRVLAAFDAEVTSPIETPAARGELVGDRPVAYFCAEFGLHSSIPIYSGGLGVLAGDHCRAASDLGIPMVGIGLLYQRGYFRQRIEADGSQQAVAERFDPESLPLHRLKGEDRAWLAEMENEGEPARIAVWQIDVGRVPIYLLDTDLPENDPEDRDLTSQLYSGDVARRIRQEMVLGIGGVRVLRALGIRPAVWHMNEGHTAFLTLERVREEMEGGAGFDEATCTTRRNTVFTTHTPVAAGHDRFSRELVEEAMGHWLRDGPMDIHQVAGLGEDPGEWEGVNMTSLALRMSSRRNGVSVRHGEVARLMWQPQWPGRPAEEVPIGAITNGVHLASWLPGEMRELFDRTLGEDWPSRSIEPATWEAVAGMDEDALWEVHTHRKARLFELVRDRLRRAWVDGHIQTEQVVASGALMDPDVLTLGFARRFASYKRATLLFSDMERLRRRLMDFYRPVQVLFAGKAHPRDHHGQELIREVFRLAIDPRLGGRVAFLEDYDMHLAAHLVSGVDVWLNNPLPPMEASGTSGMKAALNGIPHLSTLDGWWLEGYDGSNGWALGDPMDLSTYDPERAEQRKDRDREDAEALYRILEEEVVPAFYDRDEQGIPRRWTRIMKAAIRTTGRRFGAARMLTDYLEGAYGPAADGER